MGSLVGQTEANVRQALRIVDAMAPAVLFIDEVEKALSGGLSGGQGDSGQGGATADQVELFRRNGDLPRPMIYTMHDAETAQMRFCQDDLGWLYVVESPGVLGLSRCGLSIDDVHQQEWLYDDMSSLLTMKGLRRTGTDAADAYFRGMANRLFYTVAVDPNLWPDPQALSPWYDAEVIKPLNHAFLAVESDLDHRRVLPDDQGIAWTAKDGSEVIFAYTDFSHPLSKGAVVEDLLAQSITTVTGAVNCRRHGIYRVRDSVRTANHVNVAFASR